MDPAAAIGLSDKVRLLRDPALYPELSASVDAVETHFAWVFLAGDYAYKMKKPVQIERMDFRQLATRENNCREEVRLNRRLAPDVYLAVMPLCVDTNGRLSIGGTGVTVEWLVKMRRLPATGFLDHALAEDSVTTARLAPVAQHLCEFYSHQPPAMLSGADYLARLHARVDDTQAQLLAADLPSEIELAVAAAGDQQRCFLSSHAALIQARAAGGRIIEGHGDLRPEHVFLGCESGGIAHLAPCVIDCLEFDRDLRILDPVEELAFLSLECARLNAAWVGTKFVRIYREVTGDFVDDALFLFYRGQRALNRAKIAAWHLRDPEVRDLADWPALAHSYLRDALNAG